MGRFVPPEWQRGYRYISFGQNVIGLRGERPIPFLMTYDAWNKSDPNISNFFELGRFMFCAVTQYNRQHFHEMSSKTHKYHPWGIENRAVADGLDGLSFSLTTVPLVTDKGFLLKVTAKNRRAAPTSVALEVTYGGLASVEDPRMIPEFSESLDNEIALKDGMAVIHNPKIDKPQMYAAFAASEDVELTTVERSAVCVPADKEAGGTLLRCATADWLLPGRGSRSIFFVVAFGDDAKEVAERAEMMRRTPLAHLRATKKHFAGLTKSTYIVTPEQTLDLAFETAVLNLEYSWYEDLGWMEIVSYWCDMWNQSHLSGVCAIGQLGRARSCLSAHGQKIREDGKVQCLDALGQGRPATEWEHFYLFGAYHYYLASNNLDFINELWPKMVRIYDYCFRTNDKDKDYLLSWWDQLENQEDQIRTYCCGSSATMAGLQMSRIMAAFAAAMGKVDDERKYTERADEMNKRLFQKLWKSDLGRFIWWIDELGVEHSESQYHTYAWPVIFGLTDVLDSYTSLKHIKESLLSPRDIVYNSNQFPEDRLSCLGAQESILSSGVAAEAFGRAGNAKTCARILMGASRCIMDPPMEGLVPEQAQIDFQSYYSSSAANFAQGVVRGLFGVALDVPKGKVVIKPAIPDDWEHAQLATVGLVMNLQRTKSSYEVTSTTELALEHHYLLKLPACADIRCELDGQEVPFTCEPTIGGQLISVQTEVTKQSRLLLSFEPCDELAVDWDGVIAQGKGAQIEYRGLQVEEIIDRESVIAGSDIRSGKILLSARSDASLGSHTIFLNCRTSADGHFYYPLDYVVQEAGKSQKQLDTEERIALSEIVRNQNQIHVDMDPHYTHGFQEFVGLRQSVERSKHPVNGIPVESVYVPRADFLSEIGADQKEICDENSGLIFQIGGRRMACAYHGNDVRVPLSMVANRVCLLLVSYLTVEDTYSKVGEIAVTDENGKRESLYLRIPGNINWGFYYRGYESSLKWTKGDSIVYPATVLDIIGIDCRSMSTLKSIDLKSNGLRPVLGLLGITGIAQTNSTA